jgi:PTS system nitrogen regulatory IIA component
LKKWAATHNLPFKPPETPRRKAEEEPLESLLPAMHRGGVHHGIQAVTADDALQAAVAVIPVIEASARDELYTRLLERESLTSTGVGRGIAIPHPRTPLSDVLAAPAITTCFLERPVDFGAVDDRPVFVMFILLSTSVRVHLHLLSRLSFGVRSAAFVDFLKTAPPSKALFSRVAEFEARLDRGNAH